MSQKVDVLIVGAGHNGLIAACYLAKAGLKVKIIEKNAEVGGGAQSVQVFDDFDARLSRFAYLISLLPQRIIDELELDLKLLQRKTASFTPYASDKALFISNIDPEATKKSIEKLEHGTEDYPAYLQMQNDQVAFAELVWDSFFEPLQSKEYWQKKAEEKGLENIWNALIERPLGEYLEQNIKNDLLRGVLFTDGKIGSYTHAHDASLLQNKTYIYHIIGNKTGEWRVPQNGMGSLTKQLFAKAIKLGVDIETNTALTNVQYLKNSQITTTIKGATIESEYLLWNANPHFHQAKPEFDPQSEGTAFKINMLLKKLPKLKNQDHKPEDAFAGTFHIDQSYTELEQAYQQMANGQVPNKIAGEMYCHTLTDPSILSKDLQERGFHTLTFFGFDLSYKNFEVNNEAKKKQVVESFVKGINAYLEEDIWDCLAEDKAGQKCIEAKSSVDIEGELSMPRGNIFQNGLSWFFAENEAQIGTLGVETDRKNVLICGSSALRGGAVSGIPGRNAAMKIIDSLKK